MDNTNNVSRGKATVDDADEVVRPNMEIPSGIWKRAKIAAIDLGISQSQFVADAITEKLKRLKAA